jgi:ABC-type lipoprotein release transport system permease subunit
MALARAAGSLLPEVRNPELVPGLAAAVVLAGAAVVASLLPASRASRVDVMEALRSE